MSVYVTSWYGPIILQLDAPIMVPTRAHQLQLEAIAQATQDRGLLVSLQMILDGNRFGAFFSRTWTPDDLADEYERKHHMLHGSDPRGADPREGPTRLTRGIGP